jgi:hypothetical protein
MEGVNRSCDALLLRSVLVSCFLFVFRLFFSQKPQYDLLLLAPFFLSTNISVLLSLSLASCESPLVLLDALVSTESMGLFIYCDIRYSN